MVSIFKGKKHSQNLSKDCSLNNKRELSKIQKHLSHPQLHELNTRRENCIF